MSKHLNTDSSLGGGQHEAGDRPAAHSRLLPRRVRRWPYLSMNFRSHPKDHEKAILPCLILWTTDPVGLCSSDGVEWGKSHACRLALGWWHWSVNLYVIWNTTNTQSQATEPAPDGFDKH